MKRNRYSAGMRMLASVLFGGGIMGMLCAHAAAADQPGPAKAKPVQEQKVGLQDMDPSPPPSSKAKSSQKKQSSNGGSGGLYECGKPECKTEGQCTTCKTPMCQKRDGKEFLVGTKVTKTGNCPSSGGGSAVQGVPGAGGGRGKMIQQADPGSRDPKVAPAIVAPTQGRQPIGGIVTPPDTKTKEPATDGGATQVQPTQ